MVASVLRGRLRRTRHDLHESDEMFQDFTTMAAILLRRATWSMGRAHFYI